MIDLLDDLRFAAYDLINGIYSGIPLCCVAYYVNEAAFKMTETVALTTARRRGIKWPDSGPSYVRCDSCFKKNHAVEIRRNGAIGRWLISYDLLIRRARRAGNEAAVAMYEEELERARRIFFR